jgi:epoxyqueuosine reductase
MSSEEKRIMSDGIKEKARSLGFDLCGIARPRVLAENEAVLEKWCHAGMNDQMNYLKRDIRKRSNPELVFPGAKSIVVVGINYYSEIRQKYSDAPVISRYTYGKDYHVVIGVKLEELLGFIKQIVPAVKGKVYVDSGPVLEKPWAVEAGLGWQGKHSIVINSEIGSFFFIGILVLNIELEFDEPFKDEHCGECRLCIDLCPTAAINNDRTIDARKCISNLTIENRGPVPDEFVPMLGGRVYACDKCQEVCPWNKKAVPNKHPEFQISDELAGLARNEWLNLSKEKFDELFKGSPVERVKYERFKKNILAALNP